MIDILVFLTALISGDYSIGDIVYSVESLVSTGVVQEDSIFWNPDTMGNGYGFDRNGVWHN